MGSVRNHPLNVIVTPTDFEGLVSPKKTLECITAGILKVIPHAIVINGEFSLTDLVNKRQGTLHEVQVDGPFGLRIKTSFGVVQNGEIGIIYTHIPPNGTQGVDLTSTNTVHIGQLMKHAIGMGCSKIIIICRDSEACDGGAGMLQALGVRFWDAARKVLPFGGGGKDLIRLDAIDTSGLLPALRNRMVDIEVAYDSEHHSNGAYGTAKSHAQRKGATPDQVHLLWQGLEKYGNLIGRVIGKDVTNLPGSGAAGGLPVGFKLLRARFRHAWPALREYFGLDKDHPLLSLVAESKFEPQEPRGTIRFEARSVLGENRAKCEIVAFTVTFGPVFGSYLRPAFKAMDYSRLSDALREAAVRDAEEILTGSAEYAMKLVIR